MTQWHCNINGQSYGPVDEATLKQWIQEGRVRGENLVYSEEFGEWKPASQVTQLWAPGQMPPAAPQVPVSPVFGEQAYYPAGYAKPGRGGLILTLGILSLPLTLFCCIGFVLGIIAWVMGSTDLRDMNAGLRDPADRGLTRAGMIMGIISVGLLVVMFVFGFISGFIQGIQNP